MIDWVSCRFPYLGPAVGDIYLKKDWQTGEILPAWNKQVNVRGSFDAGLAVQVIGREMSLSGNVVKFLTGQNVVGTDDLGLLIRLAFEKVLVALDLPDCIYARRAIKNGNVDLTRVDCTFHYSVGSDDEVRLWLRAMESSVNVRYRGRGFYDEGMCSLIFGLKVKEGRKVKGSSLSSFKIYNKLTELRKHRPTCHPKFEKTVYEMATGVVRAEALYRSKELKTKGVKYLRDWNSETSYWLHREWINKMEISANVEMKSDEMQSLPKRLRSVYKLWEQGSDLMDLYSRATFYRHRRQLLEYGIDISVIREPKEEVQVVPVLHVLEAKPVNVTEGEELFHLMLEAA